MTGQDIKNFVLKRYPSAVCSKQSKQLYRSQKRKYSHRVIYIDIEYSMKEDQTGVIAIGRSVKQVWNNAMNKIMEQELKESENKSYIWNGQYFWPSVYHNDEVETT